MGVCLIEAGCGKKRIQALLYQFSAVLLSKNGGLQNWTRFSLLLACFKILSMSFQRIYLIFHNLCNMCHNLLKTHCNEVCIFPTDVFEVHVPLNVGQLL